MTIWLRLFCAVLASALCFTATADDDISTHDAWVRAAPPGATVLAGYLSIENHGAATRVLTGASSSQFRSVEMHRTEIKDGVAGMSVQERLEIPAHGTFSFTPNDYHLMLIEPRQPLQPGDHVMLHLQFDDGSMLMVHAPVRADEAPADDMSQHHH